MIIEYAVMLRWKKKDEGSGLKENVTDYVSTPYLGAFCVAAAVAFSITICATTALAGAVDFEIPLSELSKERKATTPAPPPSPAVAAKPKKKKAAVPKQVATHVHKVKKQADKTTPAPLGAFVPAQRQPLPVKPPVVSTPKIVSLPVAPVAVTPPPKSVPAKNAPTAETIRIDHEPYSFIVSGKSTVIHAVVYLKETDLRTVSCRVRSVETGELTEIKMDKVNGTRFTYEAILPKVPSHVPSLHYRINVTETQGKETASKEFVTPVSTSPVVPDWQF